MVKGEVSSIRLNLPPNIKIEYLEREKLVDKKSSPLS